MTDHWPPPQDFTPAVEPQRWWKRRYRRAPIWVWATGAFFALGAVGSALEPPPETDVVMSADISRTTEPDSSTTTVVETSTTAAPISTTTAPSTTSTTTSTTTTTLPPTTTSTTTTSTTTTTTSTTTSTTTTTTTTQPPPPPTEVQQFIPTGPACDPNYTGCVPIDSDVDCAGGSGNGPSYVRGPVQVIGSDIYGLDRDKDGIGCE